MSGKERKSMDESKLCDNGFDRLFQKAGKPEYYALLTGVLGERRFRDAEAVYEEGDDASDGLYLIISGKVRLRNPETGEEVQREPGDLFGTNGALRSRGRREETVLASGETLLYTLSREDYEKLSQENADFGRWFERCLLLHEGRERREAERDRGKRRTGAKAVALALLPLSWAVLWDGLVTKFAGEGTLAPAGMMILFLGIAVLLAVFFFAGRFPKDEIGFGRSASLRTVLLSLAAAAELSALFYLAAVLEKNGLITGFAAPDGGEITGGGALLFLGMSVFHLAVFWMAAGILPSAAENLIGGKAGKVAKWLLPIAVSIPVYAALEGAVGACWLAVLTLSYLFVRVKTGDLLLSGVFFLLASAVGAFGFGILFVPSMF